MPLQISLILKASKVLLDVWSNMPAETRDVIKEHTLQILKKAMNKGTDVFNDTFEMLKALDVRGLTKEKLDEIESEIDKISGQAFVANSLAKVDADTADNPIKIIFVGGEKVLFADDKKDIEEISFIENSFNTLKEIIRMTDASIVIATSLSSKKRGKEILECELLKYGLMDSLAGYCEVKKLRPKKDSIKKWIKSGLVDYYAILDSKEDLGKTLSNNLVTCTTGIGKKEKDKCLELLTANAAATPVMDGKPESKKTLFRGRDMIENILLNKKIKYIKEIWNDNTIIGLLGGGIKISESKLNEVVMETKELKDSNLKIKCMENDVISFDMNFRHIPVHVKTKVKELVHNSKESKIIVEVEKVRIFNIKLLKVFTALLIGRVFPVNKDMSLIKISNENNLYSIDFREWLYRKKTNIELFGKHLSDLIKIEKVSVQDGYIDLAVKIDPLLYEVLKKIKK